MNTKSSKRKEALIKDGVPRYVRCYDFGPENADRYTVVFTKKRDCGQFNYVGMSFNPFHPQGSGYHSASDKPIDVNDQGWPPAIGRKNHLGKRINFLELPEDCQVLVSNDYKQLWALDKE